MSIKPTTDRTTDGTSLTHHVNGVPIQWRCFAPDAPPADEFDLDGLEERRKRQQMRRERIIRNTKDYWKQAAHDARYVA